MAFFLIIFNLSAIAQNGSSETDFESTFGFPVDSVTMKEKDTVEHSSLNNGNTAWMLTATALVLFMILPGLALFYGGLVQSKNVLSVLMHCFAIACLASIIWITVGYSLALTQGGFGEDARGWIGGKGKFFLNGVFEESMNGDFPESVWIMFQMTFAIITPALIVGAFVERIKFTAVMLFSGLYRGVLPCLLLGMGRRMVGSGWCDRFCRRHRSSRHRWSFRSYSSLDA